MADLKRLPGFCAEEEMLSAFLDGELTDGEVALVAGHLDGCAECRVAFSRLKAVRSALRELPDLLPPPDLIDAVTHPGDELSAFLDGELDEVHAGDVVGHLSRCATCRGELQELDAARSAIRSLPRLEVPASILGVEDTSETPAPVPLRHRGRLVPMAAMIAAVVAAGAIVVSLAGGDATPIERDRLAEWHNARVTLGRGSSVLPALMPKVEPDS